MGNKRRHAAAIAGAAPGPIRGYEPASLHCPLDSYCFLSLRSFSLMKVEKLKTCRFCIDSRPKTNNVWNSTPQ
jgi:hypothetical protein